MYNYILFLMNSELKNGEPWTILCLTRFLILQVIKNVCIKNYICDPLLPDKCTNSGAQAIL